MTIIELFPWLLAICIALSTGTILSRGGHSSASVWIIATAAGVASFAVYWIALKWLASCAERRTTEKEKRERERRRYHDLDSAKPHPVGSGLFYECTVCGNVVPATKAKGVGCRCQNIVVDAESHGLKIRDHRKVKLFSYVAACTSLKLLFR